MLFRAILNEKSRKRKNSIFMKTKILSSLFGRASTPAQSQTKIEIQKKDYFRSCVATECSNEFRAVVFKLLAMPNCELQK